MKLALFGASGHIGRVVLAQALARGHTVTAHCRDPRRLDVPASADCRVVAGPLEPEVIADAVRDADAVIVTLAAGNGVLAQFDAAALPILAVRGPRRIVSMVGASVRMPGDPDSFALRAMTAVMRLIPNGLLQDAEGHARRLRESPLDWTLVRSANFADRAASGRIRVEPSAVPPLTGSIAKADLAGIILDITVSGRFVRQAPTVWNADQAADLAASSM